MSAFERNLRAIWSNSTSSVGCPPQRNHNARYRAKSLVGGTGWQVYDEKIGRFLENREVAKIADPLEVLKPETLQ